MSNRVDELETKVKELQAAVNGLTEELVESKERIRQLENAVDVDDPAVRAKSPVQEEQSTADAAAEPDAEADASEESAEPAESEQRFVDAEEHEQNLEDNHSDEEAKSKESNEEEDAESENGSDIIVA